MDKENTLEKIKTLIEDRCGINRNRIESGSRIEKDLRITGTDAVELIISFGKQFKVDVSKFMAAEYFEPEGMNILMPNTVPNKKVLTIEHLEKAVKAGRLDEDVINN